jgi:hypothetical protein
MGFVYFLQTPPTQSASWVESHAATIGAAVVILLFILERILALREKRRDRKENWYFNVIVLPHITCINEFFLDFSKSASNAFNQISQGLLATNPGTLLQVKAAAFRDLSLKIQDFDFEFLMTIYAYDLDRYKELMDHLRDMYDETVTLLDKQPLAANDLQSLMQTVKNQKSIFYTSLYQAIA